MKSNEWMEEEDEKREREEEEEEEGSFRVLLKRFCSPAESLLNMAHLTFTRGRCQVAAEFYVQICEKYSVIVQTSTRALRSADQLPLVERRASSVAAPRL